jgi:hypothetical protein
VVKVVNKVKKHLFIKGKIELWGKDKDN